MLILRLKQISINLFRAELLPLLQFIIALLCDFTFHWFIITNNSLIVD